VLDFDRHQPIVNLRTMDALMDVPVAQRSSLAAAGPLWRHRARSRHRHYGLLAHGVVQRRQFGIRLALGATPGQVAAMVVREGLMLAVVGVGLGLAGAYFATGLIKAMLFALPISDPLAWASAVVAILAVALVASGIPARRATKASPAEALKG
jgi:hypothetical protein